jgi:GH15 family glucan-1,4-alpha-glucosidase
VQREQDYLPIAEHGVIGDLHSAALVGTDGTIDWYCPGRFDGPSVFAAILDRRLGGFYRIAPNSSSARAKQLYLPDTNMLITRFLSPDGVAEIQDFMPIGGPRQQLVRRVVGVRGEIPFRLEFEPRFDYGRQNAPSSADSDRAELRSRNATLSFTASVPTRPT